MDVEAQDDGIMGKIITPDGSKGVLVGKLIALLAEEGDDISNLEIPAEDPSSTSTAATSPKTESEALAPISPPSQPQTPGSITQQQASKGHGHPHSAHPLFPSVMRLLQDHNLSTDVDSLGIIGTGVRGMLTKGDILAHLGLARSPSGTLKVATVEKSAKPVGAVVFLMC